MTTLSLDLVLQGRLPPPLTAYKIRFTLKKAMQKAKVTKATIGLGFVTDKKIAELNKVYHGVSGPTDVLAFAYKLPVHKSEGVEGDILLCSKYVKKQAENAAVDYKEELCRLIIHGFLHIAGYDHKNKKQEKEMFGLQEKILTDL